LRFCQDGAGLANLAGDVYTTNRVCLSAFSNCFFNCSSVCLEAIHDWNASRNGTQEPVTGTGNVIS
jgi:hypothetical protein